MSDTTTRRWLNANEVAERYGCSRVTVWRMARVGQIPKPVQFSGKMTRWDRLALDAADAERTAAA